jgi:hypothetical protein
MRNAIYAPVLMCALYSILCDAVHQVGERLIPSIVFNRAASPGMIFVLASILR